jgi:hypothetical protein
MCPVSASMARRHIAPRQLVQAGDIRLTRKLSNCKMGASAAYCIQGKEGWQDNAGCGNEDFQQRSKVSEEEVCVEATFLDEFGVGRAQNWLDPFPPSRVCRFCSFFLRDEVCSRLVYSRESILDEDKEEAFDGKDDNGGHQRRSEGTRTLASLGCDSRSGLVVRQEGGVAHGVGGDELGGEDGGPVEGGGVRGLLAGVGLQEAGQVLLESLYTVHSTHSIGMGYQI